MLRVGPHPALDSFIFFVSGGWVGGVSVGAQGVMGALAGR